MKAAKPFFNSNQAPYAGREPPFYEVADIAGLAALSAAAPRIRAELEQNLADAKRAAVCFQKHTLRHDTGWRQIELKIYGVAYPRQLQLFPQTMAVLAEIEGISTIYFSLLAPHSAIKPHVGDTDAYYRVHLGLKIPAGLPDCGIEVAGQKKPWCEGGCIAFNDIYCHSTWNDTDEERIVLILDILRPEFRTQAIYVDAGVRATLYYSRLSGLLSPVMELLPRVMTRAGRPLFHGVSYAWHWLRLALAKPHGKVGASSADNQRRNGMK